MNDRSDRSARQVLLGVVEPLVWAGFDGAPSAAALGMIHGRDAETFAIAREAIGLFDELERLRPSDALRWRQVFQYALLVKTRNDFIAVLLLLRAGLSCQAEVALRVLFEAVLILRWVHVEPAEALAVLETAQLKAKARLYEPLRARDDYDPKNLDEITKVIAERSEVGRFSVANLADRLGLGGLYRTVYRATSEAVHTSYAAIVDGIVTAETPDEIRGFQTGPRHAERPVLLAAVDLFLDATARTGDALGVDLVSAAEHLHGKLEESWSSPA